MKARWLAALACAFLSGGALPLSGFEFGSVTNLGKRFTVCHVQPSRDRLQLFLRDDQGRPLKTFEGVNRFLQPQGRKLAFAMNAGMYHPDLSPVGLFVAEGRESAALNLKEGSGNFYLKPNGVFLLTAAGARIVESSRYSAITNRVLLATQSGPLLVAAGRIHPRFNVNSTSRLIRNGVGVRTPDRIVFAIADDPVTFHEFASFFRDGLGCRDALYLDGVISSLHGSPNPRKDPKVDLGPIIGITD